MDIEILDIVDSHGNIIGSAPREEIHLKRLPHKVVHLLVFNKSGELLLQKRAQSKEIEPGKWDTSVGGHVQSGEEVKGALLREMREELGMNGCDVEFLYTYIHSGEIETEMVYSFRCTYGEKLSFNEKEIEEIRFWGIDKIRELSKTDLVSEHFRDEFARYSNYVKL